MYAVEKLSNYISQGVYTISGPFHPFGGAVDIIVVEQEDGTFKTSPWYVRFGKFQGVLTRREREVTVAVNDVGVDFHMYLDHKGEAFFLKDVQPENGDQALSPDDAVSSGDENSVGPLALEYSKANEEHDRKADPDKDESEDERVDELDLTFDGKIGSLEEAPEFVEKVGAILASTGDGCQANTNADIAIDSSIGDNEQNPSEELPCSCTDSNVSGESKPVRRKSNGSSRVVIHSLLNQVVGLESAQQSGPAAALVANATLAALNKAASSADSPKHGPIKFEPPSGAEGTTQKVYVPEVLGSTVSTVAEEIPEPAKMHQRPSTNVLLTSFEKDDEPESKLLSPMAALGHDVNARRLGIVNSIENRVSINSDKTSDVEQGEQNVVYLVVDQQLKEFHDQRDNRDQEVGSSGTSCGFIPGAAQDVREWNAGENDLPPVMDERLTSAEMQDLSQISISEEEPLPTVKDLLLNAKLSSVDTIGGPRWNASVEQERAWWDVLEKAAKVTSVSGKSPLVYHLDKKKDKLPENGQKKPDAAELLPEASDKKTWTGWWGWRGSSAPTQPKAPIENDDAKEQNRDKPTKNTLSDHDSLSQKITTGKSGELTERTKQGSRNIQFGPGGLVDILDVEKVHCSDDGVLDYMNRDVVKKQEERGELIVGGVRQVKCKDIPRPEESQDAHQQYQDSGNEYGILSQVFEHLQPNELEIENSMYSSSIPERFYSFKNLEEIEDGLERKELLDAMSGDEDDEQLTGFGENEIRGTSTPIAIPGSSRKDIFSDRDGFRTFSESLPNVRQSLSDEEEPSRRISLSRSLGSEPLLVLPLEITDVINEEKTNLDPPQGLLTSPVRYIEPSFGGFTDLKDDPASNAQPMTTSSTNLTPETGFELSLCRHLLTERMGSEAAAKSFASQKISLEDFRSSGSSIAANEKLVVRVGHHYYPWAAAAPIVLALLAFGQVFPSQLDGAIAVEQPLAMVDQKGGPGTLTSTPSGGWRLWPFALRRPKTPENGNGTALVSRDAMILATGAAINSSVTKELLRRNLYYARPRKPQVRTNSPSSKQLAALKLREGSNRITFTFFTRVLGRQQVDARIYLWKWNTRIVISDVDGTITKSDVLGQVMPLVGKDWTQSGVVRLFSAIKENGYELLFLSARAISQAYITRQFLENIKQDGEVLPDGPVVISPDGLFPSLYREVIRRAPHEFKIACLQDIRSLFPGECKPFYAGFGNRDTDEYSYLKVGIPKGKIFIINPKGEVAVNNQVDVKSYTSLHKLVDDMFPAMPYAEQLQEDYNEWNYWKLPLPDVDDEQFEKSASRSTSKRSTKSEKV